ncbi:MAG: DUF1573 domain-containing protein [Candidatus Kapaibacterium sp.]
MKHLPFFLVAFAFAGSLLFSTGIRAAGHGPLLVIDTVHSNFGAVPDTGYAERTFLLENKGDAPLRITQVRPTCGCTIASLKDSTVAPGKSTTVDIRLSAAHRSGSFSKNVYITSNSSSGEGAWLKFYGHFVDANAQKAAR